MDPELLLVLAVPLLIVATAFLLGFLMRRERKQGLGMPTWRPPTRVPGRRSPSDERRERDAPRPRDPDDEGDARS